jgi:hypothetical protein
VTKSLHYPDDIQAAEARPKARSEWNTAYGGAPHGAAANGSAATTQSGAN